MKGAILILLCTTLSVIQAKSSESPIHHPGCPPNENPANPTHLPYPNDCTKFYKCLYGFAYPIDCPPGLHWSIQFNRCEYPNIAQCQVGNPGPVQFQTQQSVAALRISESPIQHPGCPSTENPANPTHLPYPNDCTKFFKCLFGFAYPIDCPAGLHWSINLDRCEYPAVAQCEAGNPGTTPTLPPSTTTPPSTIEPPVHHPGCPPNENPANPTHLPYPNDCTKFYKCLYGFAYPIDCPPGLHWSINLNRCDYPAVAQCDAGNPGTTPKPPPSITAPPSTNEPSVQNPGCPPNENPANPTHLPYPNDCTKFYKCLFGLAYPMDCPAGTHWSINLNRCDYPAVAQCDAGNPGTTPNPPPTAPPTSPPSTSAPPIAHPGCPPTEDPSNPTHLPHPDDCSKFYKCLFGLAYVSNCPPGLHWSIHLQRCDYPAVAQCDGSGVITPEVPTTSYPPTTEKPNDPSDSCKSVTGFELHNHPKYCTKFIQCDNGVSVERDCPAGLHWNNYIKVCDYPANAGCKL